MVSFITHAKICSSPSDDRMSVAEWRIRRDDTGLNMTCVLGFSTRYTRSVHMAPTIAVLAAHFLRSPSCLATPKIEAR